VSAPAPSPLAAPHSPPSPLEGKTPNPVESAHAAGLRYVSDQTPGIRRRRAGRGFAYRLPDGSPVRDPEVLARIRSLAVSPAWTDVWICPLPNGHLQATGRDARGRKQYRCHARWRQVRDGNKFQHIVRFAQVLPTIRRAVDRDLSRSGLRRAKVLATIVRLLESTLIRVGNEEYARENRSFGLTTLKGRHVEAHGDSVRFAFRGKGGREHLVGTRDRRVASVIRRLQELPGQELYQYVDEAGERQTVRSEDVNQYLREVAGDDFTAKDFRTWAGTVLAAGELRGMPAFRSKTEAKRNVVRAVDAVAGVLGNTRDVCRRCYVHPAVLDGYLNGNGERAREGRRPPAEDGAVLTPEETRALDLLTAG
jgi:DNA topoisomerase-1